MLQQSLHFLKNLRENNNRTWFEANKSVFKTLALPPFSQLIQQSIDALAAKDASFGGLEASNCIYRIYRDVRFSQDKTPYKDHFSALIAPLGRKQHSIDGLYIEFGYGRLFLASGMYQPTTAEVAAVRRHIIANADEYRAIVSAPEFVACFGSVQGDEHKRLPAEFAAQLEVLPVLLKKQFLAYVELPASTLLADDAHLLLVRYYNAVLPFTRFLEAAK